MNNETHSIGIVMPYFGKLPNYFSLWLESCRYNLSVNWLLFTDDQTVYDFPANVKVHYCSFQEIVHLIQSKFEYEIALTRPYKLCDFRPAFGAIFEEYLINYDFWGYGDMDLILGNIRQFLTKEILDAHDRILTHGPLSLMRNTTRFTNLFKNEINGISRFKEVSQMATNTSFDEYGSKSFYAICTEHKVRIYKNNLCFADINSWRKHFELTGVMYLCDEKEKQQLIWEKSTSSSNSAFLFDKGTLTRYYTRGSELCSKEYLYVHFQKRAMNYDKTLHLKDSFIMIPNQFVPNDTNIDVKYLLDKGRKKLFAHRRIKRQLYIRTRMFIKNYLKI